MKDWWAGLSLRSKWGGASASIGGALTIALAFLGSTEEPPAARHTGHGPAQSTQEPGAVCRTITPHRRRQSWGHAAVPGMICGPQSHPSPQAR
jgi:hypothetical protein